MACICQVLPGDSLQLEPGVGREAVEVALNVRCSVLPVHWYPRMSLTD
jgi:hypothetical protein